MGDVKMIGHSQLQDEEGGTHRNRIGIEVADGVAILNADSPMPSQFRRPVKSDHPAATALLREWVEDMRATSVYIAGRNRMPLADPKPSGKSRSKASAKVSALEDYGLIACPSCKGEGWPLCDLCGGAAKVTRLAAREWQKRA